MASQCTVIVLDSVGIGEAPDAALFGDEGSDTLGHVASSQGGLALPNLQTMGLGNIRANAPLLGCPPHDSPSAAYGKLRERAQGKDSTTGHWAFMGLILDEPLKTYPNGFPQDFIDELKQLWDVQDVHGNKAASGTVIIQELGVEHMRTGFPIVYTSADPVLQIAVHTDRVPLKTLYSWCELAFEPAIARGISRVIARPFVGEYPHYTRTADRKDFTMFPPHPTVLNALEEAGIETLGIGKISSLFAGSGIARSVHTTSNRDGIEATIEAMKARKERFIFTNLVDFDQDYGHRRDPVGYHASLQEFDAHLPRILDAMGPEDLLILTADHGNDPTYKGTDHTREYVPVLMVGAGVQAGRALGIRDSFADIGQTVSAFFNVPCSADIGRSMLNETL